MSDTTGMTQWTDQRTGTIHLRVQITDHDAKDMTPNQWEMLNDGLMLMQSALNGDTEPKWLGSVGAMSHEDPIAPQTRDNHQDPPTS